MPSTEPSSTPRLHVVAAIIRAADGRVLLAQRPEHKHQGGCWEFPGGKVEANETLHDALARELDEELGLSISSSEPFMTVDHRYPDLHICLHFRQVTSWQGDAHGREGQPVDWFTLAQLTTLPFPAANRPIVKALQLSDTLMVMPDITVTADWQARLEKAIANGCRVVYLRGLEKHAQQLQQALKVCRAAGVVSLLRNDLELMRSSGAEGLHLSGSLAASLAQRPDVAWLSVACHSEEELAVARRLQADLVLLSPVLATATHPDAEPLGWQRFSELATGQPFAVYALGGMSQADIVTAKQHGARGIAAIRAFL